MSEAPLTEPPSERLSIAERAAKRDRMEHSGRDRFGSLLRTLQAGRELPVGTAQKARYEWHPIFGRLIVAVIVVVVAWFALRAGVTVWRDNTTDTWAGPDATVQSGQRLGGCDPVNILHDDAFPTWIRYPGQHLHHGQRATTGGRGDRRERLRGDRLHQRLASPARGSSTARRGPRGRTRCSSTTRGPTRASSIDTCRTAADGSRAAHLHAARLGSRPRSARAAEHRHGRRLVHGAGDGRLAAAASAPRVDPRQASLRRQLPRPQGCPARADPEHRLRGGPLPQHRRVLGAAHGHDHDPGRHVHPRLRLLRRQDRPPDLERRGRAPPRRRGHPAR